MYEVRFASSCGSHGTGHPAEPRSPSLTDAMTWSVGHPWVHTSDHATSGVLPDEITSPGLGCAAVGQSISEGSTSASSHSYPTPTPGSAITQMFAWNGEPGGGGAQRASAMTFVPATSDVRKSRFTEGGSICR